ncbi:MAG: DUF3575 domain-containing protein [Saprospiraceae bacterium]|nr:DUF3575 domain-containing protein [Saprospiraceae bacterium]
MNKFILFLIASCILSISSLKAQKQTKSNVLKYGASGLFDLELQFEYERVIKGNHSFQVELIVGIPRNIPKVYTDPFEQTGETSTGAPTQQALYAFSFDPQTTYLTFGLIPEYRFFPLRKYAPRGFYLGPYLKFKYTLIDGFYTYRNDNEKDITGIANGGVISVGGGLNAGYQIFFGETICLDLGVGIGANYHIVNTSYYTGAQNETMETFQGHVVTAISGIPVAGQHLTSLNSTASLVSAKGAFPYVDVRPTISLGFAF